MDISQYLEIFIEESKEHLQGLNTSLLELEKGTVSKDVINEVFRSAHTLKGMAATMGFKGMNVLTHDMENVLSEIRNDNMKVDANLLDVLFQCLDALERFVDSIIETGNEGPDNNESIIKKLNAILSGNSEVKAGDGKAEADKHVVKTKVKVDVAAEKVHKYANIPFTDFEKHAFVSASKENYNCFGITLYISDSCVLKSARAFIIFRTLENLGQIIKAYPSVQDIEDENFENDFSVFIVSKEDQTEVRRQLMTIAEVEEVLVGDINVDESVETKTAVEDDDSSDTPQKESEQSNPGSQSKPKTNRTVRVDIERLDTLMNLVSELIIIKNGLETVENTNQNFTDQIEYLERITTNLHDAVMKVRMVPIERVFNRFPRLIRDLSRQLEKNMEFHMSGEDTELDRTVIDEIGDPLVHLIRNSADHGIEMPSVRAQNGKNPMGQVYLKAYQDGNNVVIEVADDGNGINVAKVKSKAIERGTISVEQGEVMSEQEIIELLFRPSFSTADVISDVSGRGVGLDVVKTKIEALGGIIEVKNELGKGSKFIIRLPLTLAIIQALMVNIADEKYAIPLNTIQNIENVNVVDIKFIQNQEVINLRGQVIPVVRLYDILDVNKEPANKEFITVVIVNKGDKKAGFVVDSLIGQQEIVIKTLGKFLTNIKMIAGATILGDGDVALILDVNTLV
ncbi:MAG: chemotaxis protein CheA [Firmicutes bacterium HGW-Firmicutes-1]|jgi:two-component system chemotaxis sensor kinase CheA|nr:MAG: chemotaxis protein CheA [Firmicutes bacterium HGW-Firmicutes-1]